MKIFVHDCRRQEFRASMLIRSAEGCFFFCALFREQKGEESSWFYNWSRFILWNLILWYVCIGMTCVTTLALAFPQINFSTRIAVFVSWCSWNCIVKFPHSRLLVLDTLLKQQDNVITTYRWFTVWRGEETNINCVKLDDGQLTSLCDSLKVSVHVLITRA